MIGTQYSMVHVLGLLQLVFQLVLAVVEIPKAVGGGCVIEAQALRVLVGASFGPPPARPDLRRYFQAKN